MLMYVCFFGYTYINKPLFIHVENYGMRVNTSAYKTRVEFLFVLFNIYMRGYRLYSNVTHNYRNIMIFLLSTMTGSSAALVA